MPSLRLSLLVGSVLLRRGVGCALRWSLAGVCGAAGTSGGHGQSEPSIGWRSTGGRRSGRVKGGRSPSLSDAVGALDAVRSRPDASVSGRWRRRLDPGFGVKAEGTVGRCR